VRIVTNIDETAPTGGVQMNVFQISRELARRGHSVEVLYAEGGSLEEEYRSFCRALTRVPSERFDFEPLRHPRQQLQKVRVVERAVKGKPDLIYAQRMSSSGWSVPTKRISGRPIVCHNHGYSPCSARRTAWLSRHIDRFVMVSEFTAGVWREAGLEAEKIRVVHNGIDPDEYPVGGEDEKMAAREALGIGEDLFVVCFIGRIDEEKGVETLLEAWRILGLGPGEGQLVIVGSPSYSDYDGRVAELKGRAAANVVFLPVRRDVVTPLHAADVAVVPSIVEESFGRTVIEGLATGRPVLASRSGAIPEILTGELAEFLFDGGDAEALAKALRKLIGWQEWRPELGAACHDRVAECFTLARTVDGLEETFAQVV
jgi:glycosyltransferase involved in cell wall biosynthesis